MKFRYKSFNTTYLVLFYAICTPFLTLGYQNDANSGAQDSAEVADTVKIQNPGNIETAIAYKSYDSMVFDMEGSKLFLIGNAHIVSGSMDLKAEIIEIDYKTKELKAVGRTDSLNKKINWPQFEQGAESYSAEEIRYNFGSGKAKIKGVQTTQGDGFVVSDQAKRGLDGNLYLGNNLYTTCDLENAHYGFRANKIKMVPGKKLVTGPFRAEFNGIRLPVGLPFGIFPLINDKPEGSSGILFPSYGEERTRGFSLQNGGYYFAINEHVDAEIRGSIFSKGSWGLNTQIRYKTRYRFNGTFNLNYSSNKTGQEEDTSRSKDFSLRWSHAPETKGNSRFSSSVNIATNSYNQNNTLTTTNNERSVLSSNVSYSKTFGKSPFSLNLSARHNQNVRTKIVNVTLPQMALTMRRIQPFKKLIPNKKNPLYNLQFSWNMQGELRLQNLVAATTGRGYVPENQSPADTIDFKLDNLSQLLDNALFGARHQIPVSTNFKAFKHFTISPNFNYTEYWFPKKLDYSYVEGNNTVQVDTVGGFERVNFWSAGASMNTTIYGMYTFKADSKVQAMRHLMQPSISINYSPDVSDKYFQLTQVDTTGNVATDEAYLSQYQGFLYSVPKAGETGSIGFSLLNSFEMKVRDEEDSVSGFRKVKVLDRLSLSTSYNLLADTLNLSLININASTRIMDNRININANMTLDPYKIIERDNYSNGSRINVLNLPGRITAASLNFSVPLNADSKSRSSGGSSSSGAGRATGGMNGDFDPSGDTMAQQEEMIREAFLSDPNLYIDFSIPWSANLNFAFRYSKPGIMEARLTQTLSANGDFALSDKMRATFSTGFDFDAGKITDSSLGLIRDLHCWEMAFNWRPFGRFTSYNLDIRVKSSILKDLKISRRRSFFDR